MIVSELLKIVKNPENTFYLNHKGSVINVDFHICNEETGEEWRLTVEEMYDDDDNYQGIREAYITDQDDNKIMITEREAEELVSHCTD